MPRGAWWEKLSEEDPGQSAKELVSSGHVDVPKF